jgi:transcriptional regulator with XRE-family HTH domain
MELRAVFARNLRRLREERDYSQEELADLAGIDRTYVSALERMRYSASLDIIARLAEALTVPAHFLLLEDPAPMSREGRAS